MKRILMSTLIIVLPVLLVIHFFGCGDIRPDFEDIITEATEATDDLQTYRIKIESNRIEKGEPEKSIGWMEFVAPDRIHTISQPMQENVSGEELIQIGTVIYTRDIDSNEWRTRDWEDERFSVRNIASAMIYSFGELIDIKELRDEEIDGIDCFHYIGSMNMKGQQEVQIASLDPSDPYYEQQKLMYESIEYIRDDVEFWIGKEDYLLRQYITYIETSAVRDKGEDTEEVENYSAITTCKFSDFNEPIEIEPPISKQLKDEE